MPSAAMGGAQFVDIFHGTTAKNAASIQRRGLKPAEDSPDVATVSHSRDTAEHFAADAAGYHRSEGDASAKPAVVHLRMPKKEWGDKYRGGKEGLGYGLRESVHPKWVHAVDHPDIEPSNYYG